MPSLKCKTSWIKCLGTCSMTGHKSWVWLVRRRDEAPTCLKAILKVSHKCESLNFLGHEQLDVRNARQCFKKPTAPKRKARWLWCCEKWNMINYSIIPRTCTAIMSLFPTNWQSLCHHSLKIVHLCLGMFCALFNIFTFARSLLYLLYHTWGDYVLLSLENHLVSDWGWLCPTPELDFVNSLGMEKWIPSIARVMALPNLQFDPI
jgi:hypothetical protein